MIKVISDRSMKPAAINREIQLLSRTLEASLHLTPKENGN